MSLLHQLRRGLRRMGVDVSRYPREADEYGIFRALSSAGPDLLVDVGAHRGETGVLWRRFGYRGPILSLEPNPATFPDLMRRAARDTQWIALNVAVGDEESTGTLHISGNDGSSSSLARMLSRHVEAAPDSRVVGDREVTVRRLDSVLSSHCGHSQRIAVKVDVQGFERQVLAGMSGAWERIVALQLEISLAPLYEGSMSWTDVCRWADETDMCLVGVAPGFSDPVTGRLLQFDGVFVPGGLTGESDGA